MKLPKFLTGTFLNANTLKPDTAMQWIYFRIEGIGAMCEEDLGRLRE
jgi:hypothetical protein